MARYMKDRYGKEIKAGDKLLFVYPTSESCLPVIENDGKLGIDNFGVFIPLESVDLENAECQS